MSLPLLHASHARRSMLRAILVAALVPAAALHAQTATTPTTQPVTAGAPATAAQPADSARRVSHMLAPMVVTASRRAPTLAEEGLFGRVFRVDREHRQVAELMAGNRKLVAYARWQGREIARLETRLDYLKTTVTDSINRATFAADSATAEVRSRREAVEARLAELEGRQMVAGRPTEPVPPAGSLR